MDNALPIAATDNDEHHESSSSSLPCLPSIKTCPNSGAESCNRLKSLNFSHFQPPPNSIISPPNLSQLPQILSNSSSLYNSPTNISPSSSAFVSATQSPFLSPRLQLPPGSSIPPNPQILPPPSSSSSAAAPPPESSPFLSPCSSGILLQSPNHHETQKNQSQVEEVLLLQQTQIQTEPQNSPFSLSDDIPSSSYTPPLEDIHLVNFACDDFSDDSNNNNNNKNPDSCISDQATTAAAPRISFSFPAAPARQSFAKNCSSPPHPNRLRSCDVYIGIHGQSPGLLRFCKWLCAELELQGIACFAADRSRYSDTQSHDIADRIISSATFGVLIITKFTFFNPFGIDEIRIFLQRKNLVPIFFDVSQADCSVRDIVEKKGKLWEKHGGELWRLCGGQEEEWKEAIDGLGKVQDWKLEAINGNWRSCILRAVGLLGSKLGRKSVSAENERIRKQQQREAEEEFPFPRNGNFVGRERELNEIKNVLFGQDSDEDSAEDFALQCFGRIKSRRRGSGDEDRFGGSKKGFRLGDSRKSDAERWYRSESKNRRGGVLDAKSFLEPHLEAWIEQPVQRSMNGFLLDENCKSGPVCSHSMYGSGIACISGVSGIGKTELALEFAYRFAQRYRKVLWVGGESRYFRQNFLNLQTFLGLDVGVEVELCPLRIKTFEEHEHEALQRIRRELLRDVPYLLIIDNLESEMDWWDGRDVLELLPRMNVAATHVIITTKLPRLKTLKLLELSTLSRTESMILMKGKREFSSLDIDALRNLEENLGRLTFGLGIVGRVLSELSITPSSLLEAINKLPFRELTWNVRDDPVLKNNPFLVQLLGVVFSIMSHTSRPSSLASRMVWVGGWFAPSAIPVPVLANAAKRVSSKRSSFFLPGKKDHHSESQCSSRQGCWMNESLTSQFFLPRKCIKFLCCCCLVSQTKKWEANAVALLLRFGIARKTCRQGWIHFHEIIQLYARKKGGTSAAKAMVQGIKKKGFVAHHMEHYWAACFHVFGFARDSVLAELKVTDLIAFIKKDALALALRSFNLYSRCHAALELLRLCTNSLEEVEKSFVSQIGDWCDKSLCWKRGNQSGYHVDEYVWQDVTLLKALLLENRAKLLLRGGQFDASEELCRTCISIRTVMLGHDHPQTLAAQETLAKIVRYRSKL